MQYNTATSAQLPVCQTSTCELPAVAHNHDTLAVVSVLLPAAIILTAAITWCMRTLPQSDLTEHAAVSEAFEIACVHRLCSLR
jgi:hypothetical protein